MEMDKLALKKIENLMSTLGDFTRLKILSCLLDDEKCVSEIFLEIEESQSLVSHQLKVLKEDNLVKIRKEGTKVYYSLIDDHIVRLLKTLEEHVKENSND